MHKLTVFILFLLSPTAALAHPSHIGELAGHDHWLAGLALGLALGIAGWAALKGRKSDTSSSEEEEVQAEAEAA